MKFLDKAVLGHFEDPEEAINDYIDKWHRGIGYGISLSEFLGFTPFEYACFVEKPSVLLSIIQCHQRLNKPVESESANVEMYHEIMDRAAMITDIFHSHILDTTAVQLHPDLQKKSN